MKTASGKGWKWLLGTLLGVLGFSSCDIDIIKDMYGCPSADFKLVGDVKDADGKGIEGIRVVFRAVENEAETWENDTLYSDAKGHFEKERLKHEWPDKAQKASIKFEDVDGSEHGSFKTKILTNSELTVEQTKKGSGAWYSGEYTISAEAVLEEDN